MGVCGQHHAPAALPPGGKPGANFTGGWVGPGTGPDVPVLITVIFK
jgi:hypothetical protein